MKTVEFKGAQHEFPDDASDSEIRAALEGNTKTAKNKEPAEKPVSVAGETRKVFSKINEEAIADTLGAPVDIANKALPYLSFPTSKEPVGGSESIKKLMRKLGMSKAGDEPETIPGKAAATVGGGAVEALLSGGGIGGLLKAGGEALASPAMKAAGRVMASPGANIAAGAGGAGGGDIGKEAAKGTPLEKPAAIAGEIIGGGLTGLPASATLRGLRSVDPVIGAYERLKLAPSAAEAGVGGRAAQWLEGNILPQTVGGGGVMERFRQQRVRQLTQLQQGIADQYGGAKARPEMGKAIQDQVMDTWLQAKDTDGAIIGGLKQKYGPDTVYMGHTVDAVANPKGAATTKEIRESTVDPLVQEAANIIRATGGHVTFNDLSALKTKYGYALEPGFQKNVNDAQIGQLFDAVRKDMEHHIKTKSPEDFIALQAANKRYSQAQDEFKKYFKKLVGSKNVPVSSERAYEIVTGAATEKGRGNLEEFKHVWDALPPTERGNLSATILSRLGALDKSQPGEIETWSLGKFLSGYRELSGEAKDMLFAGKKDQMRALNDLVEVVQNVEQRITRLASTSKSGTGMIILGQFGLGGILAHVTEGDWAKGLLYGAGGPWLAAQVLTNPSTVKALAGTIRRADAAIDASARALIDLNTVPKIPKRTVPPPTQQVPSQ